MLEKEKKSSSEMSFIKVIKTLSNIILLLLVTYSIMAFITHFSLNFKTENYRIFSSFLAIFDIKTTIFKFFAAFFLLILSFMFGTFFIQTIKEKIL